MAQKVVDRAAPASHTESSSVKGPLGAKRRLLGATPTDLISLFGSSVLFLLVFIGFYFWLGDAFFDSPQRLLDFSQSVPVLLLAMAVVVCLAVGEFDLSLAFNASLSAFLVIGLHYRNEWPMWLCILTTLAVAGLSGLINGLLVTRLRVSAFITTLGTGGILLGVSRVYSNGGQSISPSANDHPLPDWFQQVLGSFQYKASTGLGILVLAVLVGVLLYTINAQVLSSKTRAVVRVGILVAVAAAVVVPVFASGLLNYVSVNLVVFLLIATVLWIVMTHTSFGRNVYAVGSNRSAAKFAGIKVDAHTTTAFVLAGLLAGMAGIMLAASQGTALQGSADGLLLPAYAGGFLSTVLMSRGRFHVWGAVIGVLSLTYVASGLIIGGVFYTWSDVVNGIVLVAAVALSSMVRRSGR